MLNNNRIFRQILLPLLVGLISIFLTIGFIPKIALSQQSDSRFNSLEFDLRTLEARLDRLESQIDRTSRPNLPRTPNTDNRRRDRNNLSQLQSFDNLATLAIETKQQVNQLEARVKKLEARRQ
ncbi:MAG: hypothetical protein CLLPBCKN_003595 [Chroococcidiopsis cubana SAG 39.79]|jgi:BMFP domain-containing protein YqiC|uniref:Uncharacterized protein n=3 Tax=Chroococcidiopsis TaxID=54298 RepID=K9TY30_CHRTP|nr:MULTISPECIES: hypothetical protein [Chroococcidiopsis]AFY86904.1 hypothetical protein Chro_1378 [Chroococcidiopsis thermalis PCC 7203]MDZ4874199.1 hypothetical protein [Chroococcidiopsis cubana SAG 39.79]RUT06291.1 hypothetical protein DSM107010_53490 [Chroococcidiopsis cubana SAG 39.79]